jgi:hypothetical protein
MSLQGVWSECLGFHAQKSLVVENSGGRLSSDAGLLVVREFDERVGLTERFAAVLNDRRRDPEHSFVSMVRQRIYGIIAGYEDQNDHDTLRHDPVFQLICDRMPADGAETASQPTLSRFENAIDIESLKRLRELMVEQFLDSFDRPPTRLMFDLDGFDDPAHGRQQLTLFHGYYEQNQYFPLIITNAETGLVLAVSLRHGTAHAALGADEDLEFIVTKVRQRWPDVDLEVRADSGFGVPAMYETCQRLNVWYTFGYSMNSRLKEASEDLLSEAVQQYEQTHEKQRLFTALDYQAHSWNQSRPVIIKAECHAEGINRRAVVTNRLGATVLPEGVYDEYVQRGESENRNKELKIDLCGGRLSDHRFLANLFRLLLHSSALNLMIHLRRSLPETMLPETMLPETMLPETMLPAESVAIQHTQQTQQAAPVTPVTPITAANLSGLAELRRGQPATWRLRIIKVAAEIIVSSRRVLIRLSSAWPHLPTWRAVLQIIQKC